MDTKNYYSQSAYGIILGKGNVISGDDFFIKGDFNSVNSENVTLINSNNNYIESGLSNGVILINTNGQIITDSGKTVYINGISLTSSGMTGSSGTSGTSGVDGTSELLTTTITLSDNDLKNIAGQQVTLIPLTTGQYVDIISIIVTNYNQSGYTGGADILIQSQSASTISELGVISQAWIQDCVKKMAKLLVPNANEAPIIEGADIVACGDMNFTGGWSGNTGITIFIMYKLYQNA